MPPSLCSATISVGSNGWQDNAGIYTQEMADGWRPVVAAVHEQGAKASPRQC